MTLQEHLTIWMLPFNQCNYLASTALVTTTVGAERNRRRHEAFS